MDAALGPGPAWDIPVDLTGTNLNSGGGSAIDMSYAPHLPTNYGPSLSPSGDIVQPITAYDPMQGPPPSKPDVPSSTTSWTGSALDAIGRAGSSAWNWITSPFNRAIDNRTTPAIGGRPPRPRPHRRPLCNRPPTHRA